MGLGKLGEFPQQEFAKNVLHPVLWLSSARSLIGAADHLTEAIARFWQDPEPDGEVSLAMLAGADYQRIFMMLYGFAIENYCKAYMVTQLNADERRRVVEKGELPGKLKDHNLPRLVEEKIGLKVEVKEIKLLKRLEEAVLWAGRYPVSTGPGPSATKDEDVLAQLRNMPQGISSDDVPLTRELTERIVEHIGMLLEKQNK